MNNPIVDPNAFFFPGNRVIIGEPDDEVMDFEHVGRTGTIIGYARPDHGATPEDPFILVWLDATDDRPAVLDGFWTGELMPQGTRAPLWAVWLCDNGDTQMSTMQPGAVAPREDGHNWRLLGVGDEGYARALCGRIP